jgi:uridylate kinase
MADKGEEHNMIVIALGGSIISTGEGIDYNFLAKFKEFILDFVGKGERFAIVAGGGKIARDYQDAASKVVDLSDEDKDWLGIHATRLNAHCLRAIFYDCAHPVVIDDDPSKENFQKKLVDMDNYNVFIASGWQPGWSTDYVGVMLAKRLGSKKVIIATSIDYVYDEDIEKNGNAHPLKEVSWRDYRAMVGDTWRPGMKAPVDPIAAKLAESEGVEAMIARGADLDNIGRIIKGEAFEGSVIK